jgi:glyoxylate/succinic semialdehyde reductase
MIQAKYPTAFPLKHQQKDMRLALEMAAEQKLQLPVASAANDLYVQVGRLCIQIVAIEGCRAA